MIGDTQRPIAIQKREQHDPSRYPILDSRLQEGGVVMRNAEHFAATLAAHTTVDLHRASDFQAALLGMAGHDLMQSRAARDAEQKLATAADG